MAQKYEFFYDDWLFVIAEKALKAGNDCLEIEVEADDYEGFDQWLKDLKHSGEKMMFVKSEKPADLLTRFFEDFEPIKAAGGMVINQMGEVLMMLRNGRWDMPKGKVEENEFLRQAALREIREECGVADLSIIRAIKPTYHIYDLDNSKALKTTYWYLVECKDGENLKPQAEEGIEEVKWVHPADLKPYIADTYPNIKLLLALYAGIDRDFSGLS